MGYFGAWPVMLGYLAFQVLLYGTRRPVEVTTVSTWLNHNERSVILEKLPKWLPK